MTNKYCYIFLLLFALVSFISIPVGNVALGIATACFLGYIFKNRKVLQITDRKYYFCVALFMGTMLLSAITSGHIGRGLKVWSDLWLWRLMPFFIITVAVKEVKTAKKILSVALIGITLSGLCAIYQGIGGDTRAAGFFGNPMTLAGWLCLYLPVLFTFSFNEQRSCRERGFAGASFLICAVALLFNGTRGA